MEADFHRIALENGLTILLERRELPLVTTLLAVRLGAGHEPVEVKGIAHYLEHCVFQGTKTRSSKELSAAVEKRGGVLNGFTDEEITAFWIKLSSKYLELSIDLLGDMLTNPAFEDQKIEKEKNVVLEEVKMYHDDPRTYTIGKVKSLLYEPPFGMDIVGTEETVKSISKSSLLEFFGRYNNPVLCVVGKADPEEVVEFSKRFLHVKPAPKPELRVKKTRGEKVERREKLKQAHIALAFYIPTLRERGRYALQSFNAILAGGASSRLFQEIRDKRGLAYEVSVHPEVGLSYGYDVFYVGTDPKYVKEVKELMLKEIKACLLYTSPSPRD